MLRAMVSRLICLVKDIVVVSPLVVARPLRRCRPAKDAALRGLSGSGRWGESQEQNGGSWACPDGEERDWPGTSCTVCRAQKNAPTLVKSDAPWFFQHSTDEADS